MSNKNISNDRCKAPKVLSKKTIRGAMKNKGKQYKKYRTLKGPTKVVQFQPEFNEFKGDQ